MCQKCIKDCAQGEEWNLHLISDKKKLNEVKQISQMQEEVPPSHMGEWHSGIAHEL